MGVKASLQYDSVPPLSFPGCGSRLLHPSGVVRLAKTHQRLLCTPVRDLLAVSSRMDLPWDLFFLQVSMSGTALGVSYLTSMRFRCNPGRYPGFWFHSSKFYDPEIWNHSPTFYDPPAPKPVLRSRLELSSQETSSKNLIISEGIQMIDVPGTLHFTIDWLTCFRGH